jgi:predicted transcriptional regulator
MATNSESIPGQQKGLAPEIRMLSVRYPELTQGDIARKVGCTTSNVSQVLSAFLDGRNSERLQDFQNQKAEVYDALQLRLLESVTHEKIANTKVMEAVTAAAILEDKARLVRGQATGINVSVLLDVAEAIRNRRANAQMGVQVGVSPQVIEPER